MLTCSIGPISATIVSEMRHIFFKEELNLRLLGVLKDILLEIGVIEEMKTT